MFVQIDNLFNNLFCVEDLDKLDNILVIQAGQNVYLLLHPNKVYLYSGQEIANLRELLYITGSMSSE